MYWTERLPRAKVPPEYEINLRKGKCKKSKGRGKRQPYNQRPDGNIEDLNNISILKPALTPMISHGPTSKNIDEL